MTVVDDARRNRRGRDVGDRHADLVADAPRVVAGRDPRLVAELGALTVDLDPAVRGADLVVARDVGVDPPAVAGPVHLVVLEHRGDDGLEDPLERRPVARRWDRARTGCAASARARRTGSGRRPSCRRRRRARGSRAPSTARCRATRRRTRPSRCGSGTCRARSRARASRRRRRPSRRSSRSRSDPIARRSRTCRRSGGRAARRADRAVRVSRHGAYQLGSRMQLYATRFGMALLTHRDPLVVGAALARWIAARTGAADVRVVNAEHPSIGYSSETVLVDLASVEATRRRSARVRRAPRAADGRHVPRLRPRAADDRAARGRPRRASPIAAPELVTDPEWLGAPFVVMPRVRRPHHRRGRRARPVAAVAHRRRARAGARGVRRRESSTTHRADLVDAAGVPARDNAAELDFWADYLDWSSSGAPVPALVDALEWCRAHRPASESRPVLLWGDVRLGNVIFGDDLAPLAVLDWDMASIGAPEHDVAWFTTLEATTRTLLGQHLDGFPDRDGTIAQYESLSGRTAARHASGTRSSRWSAAPRS